MAITSKNVHTVQFSGGSIYVHESGVITTINPKSTTDIDSIISLIKSTDSLPSARKEAHLAMVQSGFTGSLGNFT